VFGPGGASARLFALLASLPLVPLPGRGAQRIQPIHIDDLAPCLARLAVGDEYAGRRVPLVGPAPVSVREFLGELREAMGMTRATFVSIPQTLVRGTARVGRLVPSSLVDEEALGMLERGNTAEAAPTRLLLGHDPRPPRHFIDAASASQIRMVAKLSWLLPLLRVSVAIVWLAAGVVSLGLYPIEESYVLLERSGVPRAWAPLFLYGASILDIALGVATLALSRRHMLWLAQIALITIYSAIIACTLPEFWLHPYGPLVKNAVVLAAIALLYELEKEPWTTRR
jgi:hypothetical protein